MTGKRSFQSLSGFNYRVWMGGTAISNIGTWMQRIAQDWLVLTQLTHNNATAVGIVMALQFAPLILLLPITGFAADHLDRRKLLMATQAGLGVLALILALLTITNQVRLWEVHVIALIFGCFTAFDQPARQTFISELVGDVDIANAVAVNATVFNAARLIGPAAAGLLIAAVGSGWAFLINGASFVAVLVSLSFLRVHELKRADRVPRTPGGLLEGFRYVWKRPELRAALVMLFLVGTFGFNFPIFISTMSVSIFHVGASRFGLLTSMMAVGSIAGALLATRRTNPSMATLLGGASLFGVGCTIAAMMPNYLLFGAALTLVGISAVTFNTSSNSFMQMSSGANVRGRVMAIRNAVATGTTPLGAPIVGWVADHVGPRWGVAVGASSGVCAAGVAIAYLVRHRNLRVHIRGRRAGYTIDPVDALGAE